MRLRPEVMPLDAARILRDQANVVDHGGRVLNAMLANIVNEYLSWASATERQLRQLFVEPDLSALYTTRFWNIRDSIPQAPRLHELITDEGTWQAGRLRAIADELESEVERLGGDAKAILAVVDTNVFLHCHPLETFDWSFVGLPPIRIIVPVRVIEELDDRRRDRNPDIADRARSRIRWLRALLIEARTSRAELTEGISIEVYVPVGLRNLFVSADSEILDNCDDLETFTRALLKIVTSDFGMQLRGLNYRGRSSGFEVALVPEKFML